MDNTWQPPTTLRSRWRSLHIVAKWVVVGAAVPGGLYLLWVVLVGIIFSDFSNTPVLTGIAEEIPVIVRFVLAIGAALGLALGVVDHLLGRYVERRPRDRRAVTRATVLMLLAVTVALHEGLWRMSSLAWCAAWAIVPALVVRRRYVRLSAAGEERADRDLVG